MLVDTRVGEKILASPASSVHTLALIAIAKLLSPSHTSHSISLYSEYKQWFQAQYSVRSQGQFKEFQANRFGRIAEISKEFLQNQESIMAFFETVIDENSNKLVLAASIHIQD